MTLHSRKGIYERWGGCRDRLSSLLQTGWKGSRSTCPAAKTASAVQIAFYKLTACPKNPFCIFFCRNYLQENSRTFWQITSSRYSFAFKFQMLTWKAVNMSKIFKFFFIFQRLRLKICQMYMYCPLQGSIRSIPPLRKCSWSRAITTLILVPIREPTSFKRMPLVQRLDFYHDGTRDLVRRREGFCLTENCLSTLSTLPRISIDFHLPRTSYVLSKKAFYSFHSFFAEMSILLPLFFYFWLQGDFHKKI